MTIEEKAKAYDEALERARKILDEILNNELLGFPDQIREIFPELRESEDERIRKEIIDHLVREVGLYPGVDRKEHKWLRWLEKQKEQKSTEDVIKKITQNKETATKFLKSAGIMDENGELAEMYRSEQKSADYNYDNRIQYDSIKSGVEAFGSTYSFNIESKLFSQLTKEQQQLWREEIEQAVVAGGENGIELARDNRYKENRMVEWSEKDKNELATIIGVIEDDKADAVKQYPKCKALHNAYDRMLHFLKSLRPQPKQEWSEKDETIIEGACNALEIHGHTKLASMLKSLRPSWKPSEEQMKALAWYSGNYDIAPTGDKAIKSLYNDLKKLM